MTETISSTQLDKVHVETRDDGCSDVWLRKNITQYVADNPDGTSYNFWRADEIHFVADGTPSESDIETDFSSIWEKHVNDGKSLAELVSATRQLAEDNAAALLELGDIIGGE